jgi:V/A-type H+-transporting ATPase subunit I
MKSRLRKIDDYLAEARFVMRFLEPFTTEEGGGLSRALGDMPSYSVEELEKLASEEDFLSALKTIRGLEKRSAEARSGISRVSGLISAVSPLGCLPYSLDFYTKGTDAVQGVILQIAAAQVGEFKLKAIDALGDMAEIFAASPDDEKDATAIVSVIYARTESEAFQKLLSLFQVTRVEIPQQLTGLAPEELSRLGDELSRFRSEDEAVTEEIKGIANAARARCQHCSDYWSVEKSKIEALMSGEQTEQIILASFWMPKSSMEEFNKAIEPYRGLTELVTVVPDDSDKPPTLLKNPKWSRPIEALVTMYGVPTYGGFDPTVVTTPFFFAFFGICFGDAGYGLLISCAMAFLLIKTNASGAARNFLKIILIGNLCAFAFGAITFSWFGDSLSSFSFLKPLGVLKSIQLLDPMGDPMTMLVISLAIGFFQIMLGLAIAMRNNLASGNKLAAFADQGGWIVFLCGLVLIGLSSSGVIGLPTRLSGAIAAIGALVLVATQGREKKSVVGKLFSGIMSLYNVTSYLGDILSYSRLLALGLGSAAIAMVVNLLANLVSGVPYIGILLGVAIFILGHVFGMAINILGAFIHSLRLQYVEFYGKFYEASGEGFTPLSFNTQYVKLSD